MRGRRYGFAYVQKRSLQLSSGCSRGMCIRTADMAKKTTSKPKFSASAAAQPVYDAIHTAIMALSNSDAVAVLEEISCHAEAMREGIRADMEDDEA